MKMKNETPLLTVPSRSSLRKHAFYGILALVSLLGLGITQSASASALYTFSGTVSGGIFENGQPIAILDNDPFTGWHFTTLVQRPSAFLLKPATALYGLAIRARSVITRPL